MIGSLPFGTPVASGGQTKCVTGIGFRHILPDTDIRVVDQTGQTFHDSRRFNTAIIKLEL